MTTATAPRFNTQKDEFSNKINELKNVAENLRNELKKGGRLQDVNPKILNFAEEVGNLVANLNEKIKLFEELAFSISSELGGYNGVNKNSWLENNDITKE